jgi:hypothetical protein
MNQTQHIFAKDTRRFWGESVLSLTITVAFVFSWSHCMDKQVRAPGSVPDHRGCTRHRAGACELVDRDHARSA